MIAHRRPAEERETAMVGDGSRCRGCLYTSMKRSLPRNQRRRVYLYTRAQRILYSVRKLL